MAESNDCIKERDVEANNQTLSSVKKINKRPRNADSTGSFGDFTVKYDKRDSDIS